MLWYFCMIYCPSFLLGRSKLGVLSESEEATDSLSPVLEKAGSRDVVGKDDKTVKSTEETAEEKVFGEAVFKDHKFYTFTK